MKLHVLLRLTPSENRKNRPEWYSKESSFRSLLAAIAVGRESGLEIELTAVVDLASGKSLSAPITELLGQTDRIVPIVGGNAAKSWRPVVRYVRDHVAFADDDLLYFIEDDYLHLPDALVLLTQGTAEYRMLYSPEAEKNGKAGPAVDGWAPVPSGTTSFAVMGRAFREDASLHLRMSHGGGAWDELSSRALGNHETKPGLGYVLWPFTADSHWERKLSLRPLRHAVFRAIALFESTRRHREVVLRVPFQATHCETAYLAPGVDWEEIAERSSGGPARVSAEHTFVVHADHQDERLRETLASISGLPGSLSRTTFVIGQGAAGDRAARAAAGSSPADVVAFRVATPVDDELLRRFALTLASSPVVLEVAPGAVVTEERVAEALRAAPSEGAARITVLRDDRASAGAPMSAEEGEGAR